MIGIFKKKGKDMENNKGEDHGSSNEEGSEEVNEETSGEEGNGEAEGTEEVESQEGASPSEGSDQAQVSSQEKSKPNSAQEALNKAAHIAATHPAYAGKNASVHGTEIAGLIRDLLKD